MKKSILKNPSYKVLLIDFKSWLDVLGFSESMQENYPNQLCEFFYWLEQHNINHIDFIQKEHVKDYYNYLKNRPNKTRNGALSSNYLNSHQSTLKKFNDYLKKHNTKLRLRLHIKREKVEEEKLKYCTKEEILQLFKACNHSHNLPRFRARHKALLVCFYSLGMRRNEVLNLQLNDILWDKERVFIRKGKNYKERFVPINYYNLKILEDYIFDARLDFKNASDSDYVFTANNPKMSGCTIEYNLKQIIKATNNQELQDKTITPHCLRHSIATHFLQAGMNIEDIQQFLGHSSLESTQIYTHILKSS